MPAFISLHDIALRLADGTDLFSNLSLTINDRRTGLVGRNGAGKSMLLRLIADGGSSASGVIDRQGSVHLVRQHWPDGNQSGLTALGIEAPIKAAWRLTAGSGSAHDAETADWLLAERLDDALATVGLPPERLHRPIATLSGGERTRLALVAPLLDLPDILLLDEPSNNLDRAGRDMLTTFLREWQGGVLIASHDRELLEQMDRIVELTPIGCTIFGGGWSDFAAAREAARARAHAELDRAKRTERTATQEAQAREQAAARRAQAGKRARASRSQSKLLLDAQKERSENSRARDVRLDRDMQAEAQDQRAEAQARLERVAPFRIVLPPTGLAASRTIFSLDHIGLTIDGRCVLNDVSLSMTGPERVLLAGDNGSGKSSLIDILTARRMPSSGRVAGPHIRFAMLDQHCSLLDDGQDIIGNIRAMHPDIEPNAAHAAAARFGFRGRDAEQPTATLSGGECVRAAMATLFSSAFVPQLLILDEPTNHLDINATEELERMLAEYDGALLIVSHDRHLVDTLGIDRRVDLPATRSD